MLALGGDEPHGHSVHGVELDGLHLVVVGPATLGNRLPGTVSDLLDLNLVAGYETVGAGGARSVLEAGNRHGLAVLGGELDPVVAIVAVACPRGVPHGTRIAVENVGRGTLIARRGLLGARSGGQQGIVDEVEAHGLDDLKAVDGLLERGGVSVDDGLLRGEERAVDGLDYLVEGGNGLVGVRGLVEVVHVLEVLVNERVVGGVKAGVVNDLLDGREGGGNLLGRGVDLVDDGLCGSHSLVEVVGTIRLVDRVGNLDLRVEVHRGVERRGGDAFRVGRGHVDVVDVALEGIGRGANVSQREHVGGVHLAAGAGADGPNKLTVHEERGGVLDVLELELNPLAHGEGVVKAEVVALAGDADLAGIALDGLDLAVRGLKEHLVLAGGGGAHDLHAEVGTQTEGLDVLELGVGLAAVELEGARVLEVLDAGVLELGHTAVHAGGIVLVVEPELDVGTVLVGGLLVALAGVGSGAEVGHNLLSVREVHGVGRLAPGLGAIETHGLVDAIVDVELGHADVLTVDHVVPSGVHATDHLRVARGDGDAALRVDGAVVHGAGVQVVVVVRGTRDDVVLAVIAVDELVAEVVHLLHVGVAGVPEKDLGILRARHNGVVATVVGEAAPDARNGIRVLQDVVGEVVHKATVGSARILEVLTVDRVVTGTGHVELVGADVDVLGIGEGAALTGVLAPQHLGKSEDLVIAVENVEVVAVAVPPHAIGEIIEDLGDGQGVGREVNLGRDVHAENAKVPDKLLELGLGVVEVRAREVGLSGVLNASKLVGLAGLDVRLHTEAGVRTLIGVSRVDAVGNVLLDGDVVVVEVDVEVVHLVVGHLTAELVEALHREGLATHVKDETTDRVERVVAGLALSDGAVALLEGLKQRLGAPVGARGAVPLGVVVGSGHGHAGTGDGELVTLLAEGDHLVGVVLREDDGVVRSGSAALGGELHAGDGGEVGGEEVHDLLESVSDVDDLGALVEGEGALAAKPLGELGEDGRGLVALVGLTQGARDGDGLLDELVGTGLVVGDLERELDVLVHERSVDVVLGVDDLLVVRAAVLNGVAVNLGQGDLELSVALLGGGDDDLVRQLGRGHGRLAAVDLELVDGHVAPGGSSVRVVIGVVFDVQTDVARLLHLIKRDGLSLGVRTAVVAVDGLPVIAVHARDGVAGGEVDVIAVGLTHLPVDANVLHIVLGAEVDVDPVRATIGVFGCVNGGGPAGALAAGVTVDGLVGAEGACLGGVRCSGLAEGDVLLRVLRGGLGLGAVALTHDLNLIEAHVGPVHVRLAAAVASIVAHVDANKASLDRRVLEGNLLGGLVELIA